MIARGLREDTAKSTSALKGLRWVFAPQLELVVIADCAECKSETRSDPSHLQSRFQYMQRAGKSRELASKISAS